MNVFLSPFVYHPRCFIARQGLVFCCIRFELSFRLFFYHRSSEQSSVLPPIKSAWQNDYILNLYCSSREQGTSWRGFRDQMFERSYHVRIVLESFD
jgi:hypothetical protein